MTVLGALGYYALRVVLFAGVAAIGIAVGIKLRKSKNSKQEV